MQPGELSEVCARSLREGEDLLRPRAQLPLFFLRGFRGAFDLNQRHADAVRLLILGGVLPIKLFHLGRGRRALFLGVRLVRGLILRHDHPFPAPDEFRIAIQTGHPGLVQENFFAN